MEKGIGIFGLTGDPPHNGHLRVVLEILSQLFISCVDIWPTGRPDYKKCLSFNKRSKMCQIAFGNIENVIVSNIPYDYTYKIIKRYRKYCNPEQLCLFVGNDWDVERFKNYKYIKDNCIIMPFQRESRADGSLSIRYPINVSSTIIREEIQRGYSISGLVHPGVEKFIKENHLYEIRKT